MTLTNLRKNFTDQLSDTYPQTELDSFFSILMEEYLNLQRIDLIMNPHFEISSEQHQYFETAIKRLKKEEPIQYITGSTEFFGLPFHVNKNVLIPRPETEELVQWVIDEAQKKEPSEQPLKILDIGTGSGCIPISLKKHLPKAEISAIDVSKAALHTAQKNAELNNTDINFIHRNILETEQLPQKYDIIVSNPPYVRELEKIEIKNNVLENEPHLALFVEDNNALIFYNKIAELAKDTLHQDGMLFFEINQYLGKETVVLTEKKGFTKVLLKKDLFGNDRMIKAQF